MNPGFVPPILREFSVMGHGISAAGKERLRDFFVEAGISANDLAVWEHKRYFRLSAYSVEPFRQKAVRQKVQDAGIKRVRFRCRALRPKDWFYRWQETYRVMPAGNKFLIVPAWKRKEIPVRSKRMPVILDPGSAFGTGGHETTKLMIRLLETLRGKFRKFLDVGTGSGVLSIVAAKLGAVCITAFDNDAMSVRIAKKNFQENGCENGKFFRGDLKRLALRRQFDCLGANLLSKTLLEFRGNILRRLAPGGYLVLSGVAKRHFAVFRKEFRARDLRCLKVLYGRSWAAAVYRRTGA